MIKEVLSDNGEVNLVQLSRILLNGKITILLTTSISLILGLIFCFYNLKYKGSIDLSEANENEFTKYKIIDQILDITINNPPSNFSEANESDEKIRNSTYQNKDSSLDSKYSFKSTEKEELFIDSKSILEKFIKEFNDHEEVVSTLKNKGFSLDKYPKKNLDSINNLAKNFSIIQKNSDPGKLGVNYEINFIWDDTKDAIEIIQNSINLTLKNIRNENIDKIKNIINLVESERNFLLKKISLEKDLAVIDSNAKRKRQIEFLSQQRKIANELGILENNFDNRNYEIYDPYKTLDYYLRGSKNIESELITLKGLSEKQLLLDKYLFYEEIIESTNLKANFIIEELNSSLLLLNDDSYKNWIKYNTNFITSKSIKSRSLILFTFLIAGFLFSSFSEIVKFQMNGKFFESES